MFLDYYLIAAPVHEAGQVMVGLSLFQTVRQLGEGLAGIPGDAQVRLNVPEALPGQDTESGPPTNDGGTGDGCECAGPPLY